MDKYNILVIDDEQDLREILIYNLQLAGYQAEAVSSAEEALAKDLSRYQLIILDVMMEGMDGFQLAFRLKDSQEHRDIPIIFLTAKSDEDDKLTGFRLGADDYVSKPFSVKELMARVRAVLQRSQTRSRAAEEGIVFQGLQLNQTSKTATIDGEPLNLTRTEFELLVIFLSHPNKVFSRQQLLRSAWPQDVIVSERTVDVNLTRLRKKLGPYASRLISRQGYGYLFEE